MTDATRATRSLPRLVLLPGLDGTGIAFRALKAALPDFDCVVIEYPRESHGYVAIGDHVRSRLDVERPFVLVGESYAGPLVVSLAADRPPNLRGIVLCATFLRCPRSMLARLSGLLRIMPARRLPSSVLSPILLGPHATPEHRSTIDEVLAAASPEAMLRRLHDVAGVDVRAAARRITVPVLDLCASGDRLIPRRAALEVPAAIPSAEVVEIDAPHLLLQTAAPQAARHIRRFATRVVWA